MKSFVFSIFILFSFSLCAQIVSKTVNVNSAGSLSSSLTTNELNTVTNLTVTGNLDARDFVVLRDKMKKLSVLNLSTVKIKQYLGMSGTYEGYTILYAANELPMYAFYNDVSVSYNSTLSTITLPTTITSIGYLAFYYCSNLAGTLTIPASVKSIADYALYGCSSISAYSVETSNTRYSSNSGMLLSKAQDSIFICPILKAGAITIPSTVTWIGYSAFESCSLLTGSLKLPTALKTIESYAFYYCTGLTGDLTIPTNVTKVGESAFYGCSGFDKTLTIPKSLTNLGTSPFFLCDNLQSISVDGLNTKYASVDGILYDKNVDTLLICPGARIAAVTIPEKLKVIGTYSFYNCKSLTGSIQIPANVNLIGDYAFYGCTSIDGFKINDGNLKFAAENDMLFTRYIDSLLICPTSKSGQLIIPETTKYIGYSAFEGCYNLTDVTLPKSLLTIDKYGFQDCTALTHVKLSANIINIGSAAFYNCTSLLNIENESIIPQTIDSYTFDLVDKTNSVLSVPIGSTSRYKNATYWSDFNNIEVKNFEGTGISNLTSNISIGTSDDRIIISGLNAGQRIEIYNINGQLQNRFTANKNIENIQVAKTGVYIVIVAGIAKRLIFN